MAPRPPIPSPVHRSLARQLIRTEPVALVLLLALAVLLFGLTMTRATRPAVSPGPPATRNGILQSVVEPPAPSG